MDRGRMWERRGGYERVEVRRGEVRKRTDVPLHSHIPALVVVVSWSVCLSYCTFSKRRCTSGLEERQCPVYA
jgi:hypothetical protein